MRQIVKRDVYDFILEMEEVTAAQVARHFDCTIHVASGVLIRLHGEGKISRVISANKRHLTKWYPNPKYYVIESGHKRT